MSPEKQTELKGWLSADNETIILRLTATNWMLRHRGEYLYQYECIIYQTKDPIVLLKTTQANENTYILLQNLSAYSTAHLSEWNGKFLNGSWLEKFNGKLLTMNYVLFIVLMGKAKSNINVSISI